MAVVTENDIRVMVDEWGGIMTAIGPEVERAEAIKKKIFAWLKTTKRVITITGETAIAKRFAKFGDREITLGGFIEAAADCDEYDRNACLKVAIKEAEQLLGKDTVDKIAFRATVQSNSLELKG